MVLDISPPIALGLVAAAFTTVSFVPQLIRTWRVKSASELSLGTMGLNSTGAFLWLIYGFWVGDFPIIVADVVALVLVLSVLVLAVRYRRRRRIVRSTDGDGRE